MTVSAISETADILVIGGGVAGLAFALSVDQNRQVTLLSKKPLGNAASAWAQGGIAAVLCKSDSFDNHLNDTIRTGAGLCNETTVRTIIKSAPESVHWLRKQGVNFNLSDDDNLALTLEGGHSQRRIVHVDDRSGEAIMNILRANVAKRNNITIRENFIAVDLYTANKDCQGVYALDLQSRRVTAFSAAAVVLATGGAGRAYLYSSTPKDATGDGIGMAYRSGCKITNMEFFQFHPTCLYNPQSPTLLISEAVRGEGGKLVNSDGQSFTQNTHPDGDLASRDIVARAIDAEMKKTGADCVYLDCSAHDKKFWQQRFPTIFNHCSAINIHLPETRIPVVPAAHYTCGGVATNLDGKTDLHNLYAIGETADNGLHGANRLASNSLLECLVMARRCASKISNLSAPAPTPIPEWDEQRISPPTEAITISHNWEELRRIMWNYVGIVRSDQRLQRARQRVECICGEIDDYYRRHIVSRDFLELRNLAQCARLIIEGALSRRESRGLHYSIDCPNTQTTARSTLLSRRDFAHRQMAVNTHCPFSGRLITANAITRYRNHFVGFCNPSCRDAFAAAANNYFNDASNDILRAREMFDKHITI